MGTKYLEVPLTCAPYSLGRILLLDLVTLQSINDRPHRDIKRPRCFKEPNQSAYSDDNTDAVTTSQGAKYHKRAAGTGLSSTLLLSPNLTIVGLVVT